MRKALIYITLPLLCATASNAAAQLSAADMESIPTDRWIHMDGEFIRQLQQRDSILIGDQMEYGFALEGLEDGSVLGFPALDGSSVEQLGEWETKIMSRTTQGEGRPDLLDIEASIRIAAFEEGDYTLPPITIGRVSPAGRIDTLYFDPIDIKVTTIPVDTASFIRHDMKEMIEVPYNWDEFLYDLEKFWNHFRNYWLGWIIAGKWLIILVIAAICLRRMLIYGSGPVGSKADVNEPAHIVALRRLEELRSNAMWVPEKQKLFYSGVTDALRDYISRRYNVGAMEMTTAELFAEMTSFDLPEEQLAELRKLFERADFVKFAKYVATDEDNASTIPLAVRFVTQTYHSELLAQQENAKESADKKN